MINLKNLKSLFIIEEEEGTSPKKTEDTNPNLAKKNVAEKAVVKEKSKIDPKKTDDNANNASKNIKKSSIDPRSYEKMMKIITSNNIDGFDYLEFKSSLKALKNTALDEATKFQSAFAMAQTMGLSKEKLLKSADFYKGLLEKDKDGFRSHLKTAVQQKARNYTSQKDQLTQMIAQKEAQVKALTEQITQHKSQLDDVCEQESNMESKAMESRDKYLGTYEAIVGQFEQDISKIKQYLGEK